MSDQTTIRIHDIQIKSGTVIQGRYEITRHLGAGGFAQVFEAFDTNIERPVAIKFLNLHASTTDPNAQQNILARFKREAKLAAKIQHSNVVNIFDFGLIGERRDIPFIVMELLSGHDLEEQIFDKGSMDPKRALPLFVDCLEALGEAHKLGIVHKDLKPSNLFLANPGERTESLRIVDFGIAHIRDAREGRLTATGEILGTPQYLSPEYIEAQIVSPAFDVYQMGLILVEALTGKAVVDEMHPLRCVKAHSMGELDLPNALLDSPLGPVIARALHIDHNQRFANAEEFADALAEVDPASVPVLSADMPTSRLAEAGTLDSNSRIMNSRTGQMNQPTTGQLYGNTQQGYAQMQQGGVPADQSADLSGTHPSMRARSPQGPTNQMARSTEVAIQEAGIGNRGVKALVILGLAVLLLGGVAAWLLTTKLSEDQNDDAAVASAEAGELDGELDKGAEAAGPAEPGALAAAATDEKDEAADPAADEEADEAANAEGDEAPAAATKPEPVKITINSSPEGAAVYRGSEKLGTAPVALTFEPGDEDPVDVELRRRGYQSKEITVSPDSDSELTVDLDRKKTVRRTSKRPPRRKERTEKREEKSSPSTTEKTTTKKAEKKEDNSPRMLIAP
ncbi:PEGA domain-containing protein [Persicimonas caeni]|uniref:PEGA domain-containing protein n=1 Tax=Persicimonas caeni TaxID=2292766 RepID=A0A4Y6PZU3_PERCE|nr:serine/threonine-protein kinase [Persicimonas caeni]QDG53783.1 PEGA domain-containing protein [Persicimonas caeni]QED35004.1 protein kinase [Persicimonas caeni]